MNSRNQLAFELYCSKHPEQELLLVMDQSKLSAHSAYDLSAKIAVDPCAKCQYEFDRLKWAINEVMDVKNSDALKTISDAKQNP